MDIREMVEALGGSRRVSSDLSISREAVCNMIARNSVHPRHWRKMIKSARMHGIRGINLDAFLDIVEGEDE
jgi:hypothetical protein